MWGHWGGLACKLVAPVGAKAAKEASARDPVMAASVFGAGSELTMLEMSVRAESTIGPLYDGVGACARVGSPVGSGAVMGACAKRQLPLSKLNA